MLVLPQPKKALSPFVTFTPYSMIRRDHLDSLFVFEQDSDNANTSHNGNGKLD